MGTSEEDVDILHVVAGDSKSFCTQLCNVIYMRFQGKVSLFTHGCVSATAAYGKVHHLHVFTVTQRAQDKYVLFTPEKSLDDEISLQETLS